ncbi:hypothetical protein D6C95_04447 [Aureobasidium pullulans]|nr:hypothetical protein D6C95_04447 [Aureobasidium pullulans]
MSSSPEHTVSPSTEAPALSKHELQHLRFKARAPNGKIYSYGKRSRLDNEHRNRATNVVRQSPAFLTATAQEQQDMMDAAVQECDEARKKRGLHTTSMFHGYGVPIIESRRNTIGSSNSLNSSNALDTPGPSLGSPLVRRDRGFRPKSLTWDEENNHIKPGPMSAPMSVADSHPWPTALESGELKQSTYRGMPLIIIDDDEDDEDGEATQDLHTNDNPTLSTEWKKMLDM